MLIIIQTTLVVTILCASALGIYIFAQHKSSYPKILLIIHLFSIATWAFATLVALQQESDIAVKMAYASAVVLVISKYYFIASFPDSKIPTKFLSLIPLLVAIFLFCMSFFDNLFVASFQVIGGSYVLINDGPLGSTYMLLITAFIIYPIVNLWRKKKDPKYVGHVADQIKFLFIGTFFFFILGVSTNSILPVVFHIYYFNGIGPSLSLILAGFIVYIIKKHHFLDITFVIQRSLIYSVLICGIIGIYITVLLVLNEITYRTASMNPIVSGIITSIIGIFSVPMIDSFLRKKTDRLFFKDRYNYNDVLQELCGSINRSIEITEIEDQTSKLLKRSLKSSSVEIIISNSQTSYKPKLNNSPFKLNDRGALSIPLISDNKLIGQLRLGEKLSGDKYYAADWQLLETLSHPLALACERAKYHKSLQDYSKKLEIEVKKRTAELQESYKNQQDIISNIAHGLQTPLTIVENELESLKKQENISGHILLLQKSLSSVSTFIYDLLRLVSLESKADRLNFENFDLSMLLEEIVSYTRIIALDKKISLDFDIESDIKINGDIRKIEEVVLALISNSIKYMRQSGERNIHVSLQNDHQNAMITVKDSGIGIPQESLPKIFDRFYRVKSDVTKNILGSGLGLSIALAIVKVHQGNISITSQVDVGTNFMITIPLSNKK
ncbi:ATP-binding protein [Candidatus Kaiserbacteria bacterium]|nr:ATP-binding protein [Candidatus Kaiserbacteria bacterium]USN92309.1 MAG: ATP-binding protein [Candidatus Nomurabacteria bacterium]